MQLPKTIYFFSFFYAKGWYGLKLGSPQGLVQIRSPSASASSGLQEPEPHSGQPLGCCRLTLEEDLCTGEILRSFLTSLMEKKKKSLKYHQTSLKYVTQKSCPCLPGEHSRTADSLPTKAETQILIGCLRQPRGRLSKWIPGACWAEWEAKWGLYPKETHL